MKKSRVNPWLAGASLMHSMVVLGLDNIPVAYWLVANSHQVPVSILYAIALAESGKNHQGEHIPWPWALNIDGQSIFCDSRQEAIQRVSLAISHNQSVDIGLMQVNWRWHAQRFANIEESLIPMKNLSAGAAILYEQFQQTNDWWEAVGRYHDPGQDEQSLKNAHRYRQRVKQHWRERF